MMEEGRSEWMGEERRGKHISFKASRSFLLSPLSHQCLPKLKSPPAIDSSFFGGDAARKRAKWKGEGDQERWVL